MITLVSGLFLFLGVHSVSIVAPSFRDLVVARVGLRLWQGIFALLAVSGLVLIVLGYAGLRNQTMLLYATGTWAHIVATILMLPVFPLLLASYLPGGIRTAARHPTLIAVKLWAFAHLLANGSLADVILFGSILVWAVVDRISLKHRPGRKIATAPPGQWNDIIVVVGGIALYAFMLRIGHYWLIGIPLVVR